GKTSIFSHPVYLFLRKFSLQDSRGGSDQPQAWLKYVSRVTDVNMFDAIFMEALAWRLAAAINMALTGNADLGTFALNMYNRVILSAGSHSQNESQEPLPPVDEFTIARLS
ncbi:hypothetical protein A1YI_03351, partial [Escherichia coli KTE132]